MLWCLGAPLVRMLGLEVPRLVKWKQTATKRIYIWSNFCLRVVLKKKNLSIDSKKKSRVSIYLLMINQQAYMEAK